MDERRIVLEVGLEQAISFKKGCYLGQEVVERASARGHVNRKLSGLIIQSDDPSDTLPTQGRQAIPRRTRSRMDHQCGVVSTIRARDCVGIRATRASYPRNAA